MDDVAIKVACRLQKQFGLYASMVCFLSSLHDEKNEHEK
jgi:hypothetical protein